MEDFLIFDLKGGISNLRLILELYESCDFTTCAVIQGGESLWYILYISVKIECLYQVLRVSHLALARLLLMVNP